MHPLLNRRSVLAGAVLPMITNATAADAQMTPQGAPVVGRVSTQYQIGEMTFTQLLDVSGFKENPQPDYGPGVSEEEFARVARENFIPTDSVQFYMTPTLINNGNEMVLVDTGLGNGGLLTSLEQAGVPPESIDVVVITHMHPDHIGGLIVDGVPVFPNARYVTGAKEYNFWSRMDEGNFVGDLVRQQFTPLIEKASFVEDGGDIAPGISMLGSFGHSSDHMCVRIESEGKQTVLTADLANHYIWSFANPDWAFKFDADAEAAARSRRDVLGMLAADQIPMIGYHMPFPGVGYVETRDNGFRFVPASYQLLS